MLKKKTELQTEQADSDIIFDTERLPLSQSEYMRQKALALKSDEDFQLLYNSVPDKSAVLTPERSCFYGHIPNTAEQMYLHTMNVNSYYFGEIDVPAENGPDILYCRTRAFEKLEQQKNFLSSGVFDGSYDEQWSLGKVLRRFIWHDRIHAKAMLRSASALFGKKT